MKIKHILVFFLAVIVACESYEPFPDRETKRKSIQKIKEAFKLSEAQYAKFGDNDSVLYSLSKSLKNEELKEKAKIRLDYFFLGNYTAPELWIILELDRNFPNKNFYLDRNQSGGRHNFKSIEELKAFFDEMDSIAAEGKRKSKMQDSIIKANQH